MIESLEPRQLLSATIPTDYVAIGSKTVNLSNSGVTTTSIGLQVGSQYILKATGTGYIASGRRGDADFMQGTTTQVNWQDNANLNTSADIGLGMGYGSSAAKVVWTTDGTGGQVHQYDAPTSQDAGHAYEYAFTAASDGNLALKFFDLPGMYGDNSGSLSVTVYQEVVRGVSARATSGTGALVTWQNDADAAEYVVSQSTDGVNFTVAGYANAGDTGMLVTNLTTSTHYTFRVTSYTDDGAVAVGTAAAVWTNSSSAAGVYQVQSPDGAVLHRDETSALITSQSLSIANSYVVAGSAEEAVLMSLSGSATVNGRTYTPLSGAFKYVEHYTPTRSGSWGAAGHDIGPALEFEDMWQAGGTYDFNDDFVRISASSVGNYSVSVEADQPFAVQDPQEAATFVVTRSGDLSEQSNAYFYLSGTAHEGQDFQALPVDLVGRHFVTFDAGVATATVTILPVLTGRTDRPTISLFLQHPAPSETDYFLGATISCNKTFYAPHTPLISGTATFYIAAPSAISAEVAQLTQDLKELVARGADERLDEPGAENGKSSDVIVAYRMIRLATMFKLRDAIGAEESDLLNKLDDPVVSAALTELKEATDNAAAQAIIADINSGKTPMNEDAKALILKIWAKADTVGKIHDYFDKTLKLAKAYESLKDSTDPAQGVGALAATVSAANDFNELPFVHGYIEFAAQIIESSEGVIRVLAAESGRKNLRAICDDGADHYNEYGNRVTIPYSTEWAKQILEENKFDTNYHYQIDLLLGAYESCKTLGRVH